VSSCALIAAELGFERDSLLAAYDLGASAQLLQAINDKNKAPLDPINAYGGEKLTDVSINANNWKDFLGQKG
jgi:hypothetical protein